ncbi:hypothetical protein C7T94_11560 [Pedobacter yulinensis]|uniref:Uncharacterized protein n=1 Tax=Pedobacter yulinensis TaxID=2126353 RepID=A0A2T3HLC9_9SPHI|nr:hypothetical protein C7T94_11560 [Pedobacter yulinensis]
MVTEDILKCIVPGKNTIIALKAYHFVVSLSCYPDGLQGALFPEAQLSAQTCVIPAVRCSPALPGLPLPSGLNGPACAAVNGNLHPPR